MKRILLWLATALVVLYAILALTYRFLSPDPAKASLESYKVYSAWLASPNSGIGAPLNDTSAPLVLLDHTTCAHRVCIAPPIPGASRFLRYQLALENLQSSPLQSSFNPALHVALAPSPSPAVFNQPEFARSYGQITFSNVSFDRHLNRALFYTERLCGLCGGAHYILMHKVNNQWQVENQAANWIS